MFISLNITSKKIFEDNIFFIENSTNLIVSVLIVICVVPSQIIIGTVAINNCYGMFIFNQMSFQRQIIDIQLLKPPYVSVKTLTAFFL